MVGPISIDIKSNIVNPKRLVFKDSGQWELVSDNSVKISNVPEVEAKVEIEAKKYRWQKWINVFKKG